MMQKIRRKVEKETLVHWIDLAFQKALSNSNILADFRTIGIWSLNLKRMQDKMDPLRPFYFTPSCNDIVEEIMRKDLPRDENDVLYYYIEDNAVVGDEIRHFLKLPQKPLQATTVMHEPLLNYFQSQILTSE